MRKGIRKMDRDKWFEFAKKTVPELEQLSNLVQEYGVDHLSISVASDGYVSVCHIDDKTQKIYDVLKFKTDSIAYQVEENSETYELIRRKSE